MTTDEVESLLEARGESQGLDFKGDCEWNINGYAKDLLAMSNLRDGGMIIIGVENSTWKRQGVGKANFDTYQIDIMKDQMAPFADPSVDFSVEFPLDRNGTRFVVIKVLSFRDIPVICHKESAKAGTKAATIYYRNRNRRPESAPISNSSDLRDLIELAASRMKEKFKRLGLVEQVSDKEILDRELGGL
jgi:predicted HTH transcriptional regulator